jgi:hypothetical protein
VRKRRNKRRRTLQFERKESEREREAFRTLNFQDAFLFCHQKYTSLLFFFLHMFALHTLCVFFLLSTHPPLRVSLIKQSSSIRFFFQYQFFSNTIPLFFPYACVLTAATTFLLYGMVGNKRSSRDYSQSRLFYSEECYCRTLQRGKVSGLDESEPSNEREMV